jgi:hypothetical protein
MSGKVIELGNIEGLFFIAETQLKIVRFSGRYRNISQYGKNWSYAGLESFVMQERKKIIAYFETVCSISKTNSRISLKPDLKMPCEQIAR